VLLLKRRKRIRDGTILDELVARQEAVVSDTAGRPEELLAAATRFEFDDGTICYRRRLIHGGQDGQREYPSGSVVWEARGCITGPGAQWFKTRKEALRAIGK
jgi:hypothetical protein